MSTFAVNDAEESSKCSYPAPINEPCKGRHVRRLGEVAGLSQFGVNQVRLEPGAWSSQRHWHTHEDEFVQILSGEAVLVMDGGETVMRPGDCAGFRAGVEDGHHLVNRSDSDCVFLAIGTRIDADGCDYPDIDMKALPERYDRPGSGIFVHKDGTPY
ncbi:cupin domain-containing protein [Maricaulis salignorans]|uniref:cupin domain-containing protein n=1 Tax=Maricaulis salignorans TaxID=144026 RepID=UPI003A8E2A04